MGELLQMSMRLSVKLQEELLIERTMLEINIALLRASDSDVQRAKFVADGLLNNEIGMDYLVKITAPIFELDDCND